MRRHPHVGDERGLDGGSSGIMVDPHHAMSEAVAGQHLVAAIAVNIDHLDIRELRQLLLLTTKRQRQPLETPLRQRVDAATGKNRRGRPHRRQKRQARHRSEGQGDRDDRQNFFHAISPH